MTKKNKQKKNIEELLANENIVQRDVIDEMEEGLLNYAIKTIADRALPDARDGLKPVQRRTLYAMHDLKLWSDKPYRKSANVSGHVMAKYHPHSDSYNAMVNLTNDLTIRYNAVDGQGNFGHPLDGDPPAANRYTEARLSKIGEMMLKDIEKRSKDISVVDFKPNYSEETDEPVVLTAGVPFLLINGASGIATGYTTEIPSHNLGEVADGLLALIANEEITVRELMKYIKGPDLPTGGKLIVNDELIKLYETGEGSLKFRANYKIEVNEDGNTQIVITDLPPDVRKASVDKSVGIVEKISELCLNEKEKKIQRVLEVRDESTASSKKDKKKNKKDKKDDEQRDDGSVRIVIELHKTAIPEVVINDLLRYTALEKTKGYKMRAIVNQSPTILNLKDMLVHYLNHRREIVLRAFQFDLAELERTLHILQGFKIIFPVIEDVIKVIRESDDVKNELKEKYALTDLQVDEILSLQLRKLSKLEEGKIDNDIVKAKIDIERISNIISDSKKIDEVIADEIIEMKRLFADDRKTIIIDESKSQEFNIPDEPMIAILTNRNTIKTIPETAFNEMINKGILKENKEIYTQAIKCKISDEFVLMLENGEYVKCGFSDLGLLGFIEDKKIVGLFVLDKTKKSNEEEDDEQESTESEEDNSKDDGKNIVVFTKKGLVKKSKMKAFKARSKRVAKYININDDDAVLGVYVTDADEKNTIVIATKQGIVHRFYEKSFSSNNAGGNGLPGISPLVINEGDEIVDFTITKEENDENKVIVLYIKNNSSEETYSMKSMSLDEFKTKGRISRGIVGVTKNFNDEVIKVVVADNDFMVIDKKGNIQKQKFVSIPIQNRYNKANDVSFSPNSTNFIR